MTNVKKEILGFDVTITGVVTTLAEAVEKSGSEQRVVDMFNNYVLFHQHFSKMRNLIVSKLEELTTIKRLTNEEGDVTEKDTQYIARLEDEGVSLKDLAAQINEAVAAVSVDYSASVRGTGTGSGKVAQKWLAYYDAFLQAGKLEAFCIKHGIDSELEEAQLKLLVASKVKDLSDAAQKAALAAAADV